MVAGRGRGAGRFAIFWSMGGTGFWWWHALRAFRNPAYRRLWVAIIVNGFAVWVSRLTVGWFVFDETGSALLTAISFTMQSAPGIVVAPFGGAVADRIDRRYVLAGAAAIKGLAAVGLAWVAVDGMDSAWPVIALLAVAGAMTSFELPASQALIPDVGNPIEVGEDAVGKAMSPRAEHDRAEYLEAEIGEDREGEGDPRGEEGLAHRRRSLRRDPPAPRPLAPDAPRPHPHHGP